MKNLINISKKNHFETIEILDVERTNFNKIKDFFRQNYLVIYFISQKKREDLNDIEMCQYYHRKQNLFYCDDCNIFFCEFCLEMTHKTHFFTNILIEKTVKKALLKNLMDDIEDKFCETNFTLIDEFKQTFENDYNEEINRIKKQYDEIRRKVNSLEKLELDNLEKSKSQFLNNKFQKNI